MATPTTWSHSQIEALLECGERYRLEKVAHAPRMPAWWFVSGSSFHAATEAYDLALFHDDKIDIAEAFEHAWASEVARNEKIEPDRSKWQRGGRVSKATPNKEDGDVLHGLVRAWCEQYVDWRAANPEMFLYTLGDDEPAIEIAYSITVAGEIVRGAIDRVFMHNGYPLIVDLKTGARKPKNNNQLSEYGIAFAQLFDEDVKYGAFYMARDARLLEPVELTYPTRADFEDTLRKVTVMRDNKIYIPQLSERCKACGVNKFCKAYGGSEAHVYEGVDE